VNARLDTRAMPESFELLTDVVTTQQLVRYAGASDDYNRIHYDLPFANEAGLGGVIAHGMLTMGFMARAVTDWAGPRGQVRRIAARFTAPVRPGDMVRVTGSVLAQTGEGEATVVQCRLSADVDGRPVASGEATVVVGPGGVHANRGGVPPSDARSAGA
jgi:acyl dehydratase